jgi:oligoendopeptidase F
VFGIGVDIRTPEPFLNAMKHFEKWVNELEELLSEKIN